MILLGVWGFKHAKTSRPWVQFMCNMYQGKEDTQSSQKINCIYYSHYTTPRRPTYPPTPRNYNNYLSTRLFFSVSDIHRKLGSIVSPFSKKTISTKIYRKKVSHSFPVFTFLSKLRNNLDSRQTGRRILMDHLGN